MADYKPDFTAWFVLQGTIAAMHHPNFYSESNNDMLAYYMPLAKAASSTRLMSRFIYQLPYSWQYAIGEMVTNPGRLRHYYLRKQVIKKQMRTLLVEENIEQVIVLGGGLDVLSLTLAEENSHITFIEIDIEDMQNFKQEAMVAQEMSMPTNIEFVSGDLREPLAGILKTSKLFKPDIKTLWLAEGFLMFLTNENVQKLFSQIRSLSAAGSFLIFTCLPSEKQGSVVGQFIQDFVLNKEKTPFKSFIPFEAVDNFMKNIGYKVIFQLSCKELHKNHIGDKLAWNHSFAEDIHIAKSINM